MNIIEQFEKDQIKTLIKGKKIPQFHPGDTVRVNVKVREGTRERIQAFEGVCIRKKNRGLSSSFTVRKISIDFLKPKGKASHTKESCQIIKNEGNKSSLWEI